MKSKVLFKDETGDISEKELDTNVRKKKKLPRKPCQICGLVLSNAYSLSCHVRRTHNNYRPFKCDECPAAFLLRTELAKHIPKHSSDRPFKCIHCENTYKTKQGLHSHTKVYHKNEYMKQIEADRGGHQCSQCNQRFRWKEDFLSHEEHAHTQNNLKCSYCYRTFLEIRYREEHENLVHKKKERLPPKKTMVKKAKNGIHLRSFDKDFKFYPCKICSERFKFRKEQLAHYQISHREEFDKNYKICKICHKILTNVQYQKHIKVHEGDLPYACNICDYKFAEHKNYKLHISTHSSSKGSIKCAICLKVYKTEKTANFCKESHNGNKDVPCKLCDELFFTINDLFRHKTLKHIQRNCRKCSFETFDRDEFHAHRQIHRLSEKKSSSEILLKCSLCNFETLNRRQYGRHKRKHGVSNDDFAEKSFMCDKCGSLFKTPAGLKQHLNHHEKDKKEQHKEHNCSYCDYKASNPLTVYNHCLKFHKSEVVKKCELCTFQSVRDKVLSAHLWDVHLRKKGEEFFILKGIKKKLEEDKKTFNVECFICGYAAVGDDLVIKHLRKHVTKLQEFLHFCPESGVASSKNVEANEASLMDNFQANGAHIYASNGIETDVDNFQANWPHIYVSDGIKIEDTSNDFSLETRGNNNTNSGDEKCDEANFNSTHQELKKRYKVDVKVLESTSSIQPHKKIQEENFVNDKNNSNFLKPPIQYKITQCGSIISSNTINGTKYREKESVEINAKEPSLGSFTIPEKSSIHDDDINSTVSPIRAKITQSSSMASTNLCVINESPEKETAMIKIKPIRGEKMPQESRPPHTEDSLTKKLKTINGKAFLSLEDLCSMDLNKEMLLKLMKKYQTK